MTRHFRSNVLGATVACIALVATACGSSKNTTSSGGSTAGTSKSGCPTDFKPIKSAQLSVVTSLPGPGFWDGSEDDPSKVNGGYEYSIVQALKGALCVDKVDVRNVPFDGLVAGTVTDFDVAFSQVTITPDRAKVVQFTAPYFEADQGVLVAKGKTVATVADAKALRWGAQSGTTGLDFLNNRLKPSSEPQIFQQLPDGFTALQAGQVEAFIMDVPIVLTQAAASKNAFVVAAQFKTGEQYGAILPKESKNKAAFDKALGDLKTSGKLAEFAKKSLGGDPSAVPVLTVP
jgi:polar amino acid transport system substrate-binding protein